MSIKKKVFGVVDGKTIYKVTITNGNIFVDLINYGARIISLRVPNKKDELVDIVAGYNTLEEYVSNFGYAGATVGRVAGRIENGKFNLNEKTYQCSQNQKGHTLHGGISGFDKKVWEIDENTSNESKVVFHYISIDGEEGFPGTLNVKVIYSLTKDNSFRIEYEGFCDADTIVGLMNHSYFNLGGDGSGNIYDTEIQILSNKIALTNSNGVVDGRTLHTDDTIYDFKKLRKIGNINNLCFHDGANTYDINYIFDNTYKKVAVAFNRSNGIIMEIFSDAEGMQFYVPKVLRRKCKNGNEFCEHDLFCFETQRIPNSINCDNFSSPILKRNENYYSVSEYKFKKYS